MSQFEKLHTQIVDYIDLVLPDEKLLRDLQELKAIHLKAVKPKTRAVKPKVDEVFLELLITEAGKTTSIKLEEKQAEKYLTLKKKEHTKKVDLFLKQKHLTSPSQVRPMYYPGRIDEFEKICQDYKQKLSDAGLTFEVQIIRC